MRSKLCAIWNAFFVYDTRYLLTIRIADFSAV